jgi:hypothetical protein
VPTQSNAVTEAAASLRKIFNIVCFLLDRYRIMEVVGGEQ